MNKTMSVVLLLIMLGANVFLRLQPAVLAPAGEQAAQDVRKSVSEAVRQRVDVEFGNEPLRLRESIAKKREAAVDRQSRAYAVRVAQERNKLKREYQDDSGQTFLLESDPYHWFRMVSNLLTSGSVANAHSGRQSYDSFMLAPEGMSIPDPEQFTLHRNFHVYLAAAVFSFLRVFDAGASLMHFLFYMPIFISVVLLTAVFLISMRMAGNRGEIAGFCAAIAMGCSSALLYRSVAGWFDTDVYVILFSVLCMWLYYESLRRALSRSGCVFSAALGGLCAGLFSMTWDGWWYVFDLIVIAGAYYSLIAVSTPEDDPASGKTARAPVTLLTFVLSGVVFVIVFSGWRVFLHAFTGPYNLWLARDAIVFWPNIFATVEELRRADLFRIVRAAGGEIPFISCIAYVFVLLKGKRSVIDPERKFLAVLLGLWLFIVAIASLQAERFAILLTIPFSLCFGLVLTDLSNGFLRGGGSVFWMRMKSLAVFLVIGAASVFFVVNGYTNAKSRRPDLNRTWDTVLIRAKNVLPADAIIASWWDYGHWIKAVAERRVFFDNATQNTPVAYWIGRVLVTDNEAEARGILRMLASGSNRAFDTLKGSGFSDLRAVEVLRAIIPLNEEDAYRALSAWISDDGARRKILALTHHPRHPVYMLVASGETRYMSAISYAGNWDFKRAVAYARKYRSANECAAAMVKIDGYTPQEAARGCAMMGMLDKDDVLYWLGRPMRYYAQARASQERGNLLFFGSRCVVDRSVPSVFLLKDQKKPDIPASMFYVEEGKIKETVLEGSTVDMSVFLMKDKKGYTLALMDKGLANALYTRLYFLNGEGLKYFKPCLAEESPDGATHVKLYEVVLNGE